jgi:hypothetical protein
VINDAVVRDVVHRDFGPAGPTYLGDRPYRCCRIPRCRIVPIGDAQLGLPGKRRIIAALVEVVQCEHRKPTRQREMRFPAAARPGEQDDSTDRRLAHEPEVWQLCLESAVLYLYATEACQG